MMQRNWDWTVDGNAIYREKNNGVLLAHIIGPGHWQAEVETDEGEHMANRRIDRRLRTRHGAMCLAHRMIKEK